MKRITLLIGVLALALAAGSAHALTPQQEKMKTCNTEASGKKLKGDERKAFIKDCLSADAPAGGLTPQQEKMKSCNADAGGKKLKGAERKAFMKTCLSGAPADTAPAASPAQ